MKIPIEILAMMMQKNSVKVNVKSMKKEVNMAYHHLVSIIIFKEVLM